MTDSNLRPSLATRLGLVVTPSRMPRRAASLISSMFAVSMKNFMGSLPRPIVFGSGGVVGIRGRGDRSRRSLLFALRRADRRHHPVAFFHLDEADALRRP